MSANVDDLLRHLAELTRAVSEAAASLTVVDPDESDEDRLAAVLEALLQAQAAALRGVRTVLRMKEIM